MSVAIKPREMTMSKEKPTKENKTKADDLIKKATKDAKVELSEEDLKRVSGGAPPDPCKV
jgi:hypothetical protein